MSWERELEVAMAAVREAGAAVMAHYGRGGAVAEKDGHAGPVTAADQEADAILAARLLGAFPDDGWLSEETADTSARLARARVWIVDPLDGTREFVDGLPEFAVSAALVQDGAPVVGAVYNPATDTLIAGAQGLGCLLDGRPAAVSAAGDLSEARVECSRSEMRNGVYEALGGSVRPVALGSVAWKVARVAAGLSDATFTPRPRSEWDLAGGVATLLAAGGRATDGSGAAYVFNRARPLVDGVCCTNGALHAQALAALDGLRRAAPTARSG